jgi:hypothetical protein
MSFFPYARNFLHDKIRLEFNLILLDRELNNCMDQDTKKEMKNMNEKKNKQEKD